MYCRRLLLRIIRRTFKTGLCATPVINANCQSQSFSNKNEQSKFQLSELTAENLTYEYMMKQSALDSVNNVSKMITITYYAVETTSKEYRDLLIKLINLTRESFMFDVGDEHWDEILNTRLKIQNKKRIVTELTSYMEYIQKMAVATTDICYSVGMENLSHTLNERIDDALNKIRAETQMNSQLESEYTDIQEQSIEKSKRKAQNIINIDEDNQISL